METEQKQSWIFEMQDVSVAADCCKAISYTVAWISASVWVMGLTVAIVHCCIDYYCVQQASKEDH